jgi:hypothetical protein
MPQVTAGTLVMEESAPNPATESFGNIVQSHRRRQQAATAGSVAGVAIQDRRGPAAGPIIRSPAGSTKHLILATHGRNQEIARTEGNRAMASAAIMN